MKPGFHYGADDDQDKPVIELGLLGTVMKVELEQGDVTLCYADGRRVHLRAVGWEAEYISVTLLEEGK